MGSNKFTGKDVPCLQCKKIHYRPINCLQSPKYFCCYKCFTIFRTGRKTKPRSEEVKRKISQSHLDPKTRIRIPCDKCGKVFEKYKNYIRKRVFCSKECYWQSATGRRKNGGYWLLLQKTHPHKNRGGYVYEHRLIVEKIIGRFLDPAEAVHHINENKGDNRPENLYLFPTDNEHITYHHAVRRGERKPIKESNIFHNGITEPLIVT